MDEQRRPEVAQDRSSLTRLLRRVGRDADVERLALAHRGVQRAHGLLERSLRIEPVRVEDVHVVDTHAQETLIEAREQVLARPPLPVRPGPHVVARLRRQDQLVAVGGEVASEQAAEVLLRRAVRWTVVVGEIEVRDAEVECAPEDGAARIQRTIVAEVVPEAQRDGGQEQPTPAAAVVAQAVVAIVGRNVRHACLSRKARTRFHASSEASANSSCFRSKKLCGAPSYVTTSCWTPASVSACSKAALSSALMF